MASVEDIADDSCFVRIPERVVLDWIIITAIEAEMATDWYGEVTGVIPLAHEKMPKFPPLVYGVSAENTGIK